MRIAIAVDGSENSLRAVRYSLELTNKFKQLPSLLLLNVHISALISPVARGIDRKQVEQYMDEIAEEELAHAKTLVSQAGLSADVVKGHGEIVPTILEIIKKENIDLLIVGGKGRSGLADLLIGSTTTKLISHCPIPVTVVK